MLKSLARQFVGWLDRVVEADDRVVCAICDQRFHGFDEGGVHVRRAHPQYVMSAWQPAPVPAYSAASTGGRAMASSGYAFGTH